MRRLSILVLAVVLCGASSCSHKPKPSGPALVYVLRVSYPEWLEQVSGHSRDSSFLRAIEQAQSSEGAGASDFLVRFVQAYGQTAPSRPLASLFARSPALSASISRRTSDADMTEILRALRTQELTRCARQIEERFTPKEKPPFLAYIYYYLSHDTAALEETALSTRVIKDLGAIEVTVYGNVQPERMHKLMLSRGEIGFWDTYENTEIYPSLVDADKMLDRMIKQGKVAYEREIKKEEKKEDFFKDAIVNDDSAQVEKPKAETPEAKDSLVNPLFRLLNPMADQQGMLSPGPGVGIAYGRDTARINYYLGLEEIRAQFPRNVKLLWGTKSINPEQSVYELFAIKTNPSAPGPRIGGSVVTDVRSGYGPSGMPNLTLSMNEAGAGRWERMTGEAAEQSPRRCIAITIDDQVYSYPRVQNRISGGNTEVSGISSSTEAMDLANILKYGSTAVPLIIAEERLVPAAER